MKKNVGYTAIKVHEFTVKLEPVDKKNINNALD